MSWGGRESVRKRRSYWGPPHAAGGPACAEGRPARAAGTLTCGDPGALSRGAWWAGRGWQAWSGCPS